MIKYWSLVVSSHELFNDGEVGNSFNASVWPRKLLWSFEPVIGLLLVVVFCSMEISEWRLSKLLGPSHNCLPALSERRRMEFLTH
jgi:hypothetical protein